MKSTKFINIFVSFKFKNCCVICKFVQVINYPCLKGLCDVCRISLINVLHNCVNLRVLCNCDISIINYELNLPEFVYKLKLILNVLHFEWK